MSSMAFEVTQDDIANVLRAHSLRVVDSHGHSFEEMAEELIGEIDLCRVEKAALAAGTDMDRQTQAAFDEIKNVLVDMGVLDF